MQPLWLLFTSPDLSGCFSSQVMQNNIFSEIWTQFLDTHFRKTFCHCYSLWRKRMHVASIYMPFHAKYRSGSCCFYSIRSLKCHLGRLTRCLSKKNGCSICGSIPCFWEYFHLLCLLYLWNHAVGHSEVIANALDASNCTFHGRKNRDCAMWFANPPLLPVYCILFLLSINPQWEYFWHAPQSSGCLLLILRHLDHCSCRRWRKESDRPTAKSVSDNVARG